MKGRAIAVFLAALLCVATAAQAAVLTSFESGAVVVLDQGDPSALANMSFTNPSRAMSASLNVTADPYFVSYPQPVALAWNFTWQTDLTATADPASLRSTQLASLGAMAAEDGAAETVAAVAGKPGLLLEVAVPPGIAAPRPWNVTFRVAATADAAAPAGGPDFALALFAPPSPRPWNQLALAQAPDNASVYVADLPLPPVHAGAIGSAVIAVLFALNSSATLLAIDSIQATFYDLVAPLEPTVVVAGADEPIWGFEGPEGPLRFGRTDRFGNDSVAQGFLSNGTVAGGTTAGLFLPANVSIRAAYAEVAPKPASQAQSSDGLNGVSLAASGATAAGEVYLDGFPVIARPTSAELVLSNVTATGVADARMESLTTTQTVGNNAGSQRAAAQTFTVESDGLLTGVALYFENSSARPLAPLVVELRDVGAGSPGSTTLATATFTSGEAVAGGWVQFDFPPTMVTAGQALTIVVTAPLAPVGQYWDWRADDGFGGDLYANGSAFWVTNSSGIGTWNQNGNVTLSFRALMDRPFDPIDRGLISAAGAAGAPVQVVLPNSEVGFKLTVPGTAVGIDPAGGGAGRWNATIFSALPYDLRFNWSASMSFQLYPQAVEVGVGNRPAAFFASELSGPTALDLTAELSSALASSNFTVRPTANVTFWDLRLRVASLGPAGIGIDRIDIAYGATVSVSGFESALNGPLAGTPAGAPSARAGLKVVADEGRLLLSDLSVTYSEAPQAFSQPTVTIMEGAVNATIADLYQIFHDDHDRYSLAYQVVSVLPAVATTALYRSSLDANLTLTMTDLEFSGIVLITVMATDSTGLSALSGVLTVDVQPADDAPVIAATLPDLVLPSTTGYLDVAPLVSDNDTADSGLTMTASSAFASVNGLNLSFDYRGAPASLPFENVTITISDGNLSVSAVVRVLINNAGRPVPNFPSTVTVTVGRQVAVDLDPYVTDGQSPSDQIEWELLLVEGVGPVAGDAQGSVLTSRTLVITGVRAGDVEVTLAAIDPDGNRASGTLRVHVVDNLPPRFVGLDGTRVTVSPAGPAEINLSEYLRDDNDVFGNFTFTIAWDNGSIVQADVENGRLLIAAVGPANGHARIVVTANDPSGAIASAAIEVDVAATGAWGAGILPILVAVAGAAFIGFLVLRSRRKAQSPKAKLSTFEAESPAVEGDDREKRLASPEGLERTEDEKMEDLLDQMEHETDAPRLELPPVTIISRVGDLAASSVLLLYRDGRPMAWVAASSPEDKDVELEEELAAAVAERLKKARSGERIEGELIEMGGSAFAIEGRSQLVMAARMRPGADEPALRDRMRDALDLAFDRNATALKRWDGSKRALKGLDEALEPVFGGA